MGDLVTGTAPSAAPLPARSGPLPAQATQQPAGPTIAPDAMALTPVAPPPYQYFGHEPKVTLSWLMKQPIWQDDRTGVTGDQWAQMPEAQQKEILAMIPTEPARAEFLSNVSPAVMKAKAELGAAVKHAWDDAQAWQQRYEAEHPAAGGTDAQVDSLNKLIESGEPKQP